MHDRRTSTGGVLVAALVFCAMTPAMTPARAQSATATLAIHVRSISPKGGLVRLGLYDAAGYPDDKGPVASADVPATRGETVIVLKNLTPGTYAIEAYQDTNSNDKMDKSWIGLPLEPYGFSRDAKPVLSKPAFDRVKFTLAPGANVQTLHLQNSDAPGE
jgi:uncharacterized protein (DUF2141 family)